MNDLSRRDVVKVLAAGGAVGGLGSVAAAGVSARVPTAVANESSPGVLQAAAEAQRATMPPLVPGARTAWARVSMCVSWDRRVMLTLDDGATGLVELSTEARMLAVACQANGRPLAVRVWGHDPAWGGVGRFEGALAALDISDLGSAVAPGGLSPSLVS